MTDAPEEPATPAQKKRRWRKRTIASFAAGVLTAGGAIVALGPAAPWVVDQLADGQRVWRLGTIKIDGVHGAWLGALRAEHVTIEDKDGVWLEARNLDLTWRPQDILFGGVRLDRAHAESISVLRKPTLLDKHASSGSSFDIQIGDLTVDHLDLAQSVVDQAAQFSAKLQLDLRDDELHALDLNLRRLDSDADRIIAIYRNDADYALNVDVESAPGGVLARMLGVSDDGLRLTAEGAGALQEGRAQFGGTIGKAEMLAGTTTWSAASWSTEGRLRIDLLPGLQTIAQRIGGNFAFNGEGQREGDFRAHAQSPFFAVDATGKLNEEQDLDGPAHFVATTQRISDIAREAPFEFGAARLEGQLTIDRGTTAIEATLDASQLDILGHNAHLTGPIRAKLDPREFRLTADLTAPQGGDPLFAQARLRTELAYNRARGRFSLDRAAVDGDAIALDAAGWVNEGDGEFSGAWNIKKLQALTGELTGAASGRYRAFATARGEDHVWTTTVSGNGANIAGKPEVLPQLLGRGPTLDGRFLYENDGITVEHMRVQGAQFRGAATGRIVHGDTNLALEATARGPLNIGDAEIAGAVDATGRLTGRIARPTLNASAQLSSFAAGGVIVAKPQVDFTLTPSGDGYRGHADVLGTVDERPMTASADIGINGATLAMDNLVAQIAALEARGKASITPQGMSATLALNGMLDGLTPGMTGRVLGDVTLTPQTLQLTAQIADARAGTLRIRAANVTASGPLDAIAARFDLRGRLNQASLAFTGTATIDTTGRDANARIEGSGLLADSAIATRTPIVASWGGGETRATFDLAMADGTVKGTWSERGRALSGSAEIENAPLAPLASIFGERATGRIAGRFNVASSGAGLSGAGDLTFDDARFAGRQRGTLDMHVVANLDPSRLTANVDATSSDGLVAHLEADAPVTTSAAPIRVALARERRGRATWSLHGPAETLWAAARLQDQSLQGNVNGEGTLEFGAGYLSGDGQLEITDGRFEDKLSGITLVNLDALISIGDNGVNIDRFTAEGPRGGHLTATGGSANDREGRVAVTVDDMMVANRPDARARASGQLTLAWQGLQSSLTGALTINEADLDIAAHPEAGIPTMDVVEINLPGDDDEDEEQAKPSPRYAATTLDVRINAPGRIFTRGRGLDAEWSLDLRLTGTAAEPRLYGEARSIRGQLAISGQPFELEESTIDFNGDPLDARVNISAVRDTADLTARIRLTGTAREPDIAFSSDPALPEDEILPQILFGHSVADLNAFEAAQLAASLAALSGRASFDLVDAARAAAGLDRFNVRQDETGGFLVAGGVYLTREVYVEVARNGLGQAQTSVEWTIRPRLVLVTSFLANGDQRVSLRWRRESD